jgi:hypothetical protein
MPSNEDFAFVAPGATGVDIHHPLTVAYDLRPAMPESPYGPRDLVAVPQGEPRKKFAICGFASSSRHRMPVLDPAWEIWCLNQLYRHIPRADREFDIHDKWEEGNVEGTDHPRWLKQFPGPIYMVNPPEDIPTGVRYPIERMVEKFGDYYTSTVAAMLALAIDEIDRAVEVRAREIPATTAWDGYAICRALYSEYTIGIFGIDLVVGTEYFHQKACVEYYIGQACGRGIEVFLPPETALCKQQYRYGWQTEPDTIIKQSEVEKRLAALVARKNRLVAELQTVDGAAQECDFNRQILELRNRGALCPYPVDATTA